MDSPLEMVIFSELHRFASKPIEISYNSITRHSSPISELNALLYHCIRDIFTCRTHHQRQQTTSISKRRFDIDTLHHDLDTILSKLYAANDRLVDTSIGIHGLDILMTSSIDRQNASDKLAAIRAQLDNFDSVQNVAEYVKSGSFGDESLFIENMRAVSRAIRYFSECSPSTEVQLYLNKYVEFLRVLLPNLIRLINESTTKVDKLVELTSLFSYSTFNIHEYHQIICSYTCV